MILGIDHIALSVTDIDKGVKAITQWGYSSKFIEKEIENNVIKKPYLNRLNEYHDIAYCQPVIPGVAIELTAHNRKFIKQEDDNYKIVFEGKDIGVYRNLQDNTESHIQNCDIISEVFDIEAKPVYLSDFDTISYLCNGSTGREIGCANIKCVIKETSNFKKSLSFWNNLGFSLNSKSKHEEKWRLLEFKSPLSSFSLELLLINRPEEKSFPLYKLDMPGFTCIALLTNDIFREISDLNTKGIKTSNIFSLKTGNNFLKICLLSGPDGECVELIQVEKNNER